MKLKPVSPESKVQSSEPVDFFNLHAGATSYAHKAANLLHAVMLEVGTEGAALEKYLESVTSCLSDQGILSVLSHFCLVPCSFRQLTLSDFNRVKDQTE